MGGVHDMANRRDPTGGDANPSVFGVAAGVTLVVVSWLYGVHVIILGEANTWVGHITHLIRDCLLAFPLAVLAVGVGRWQARRWGMREASAQDRIGQAAIIALAFAVCLVPATGVHQFLDRLLDSDSPGRVFHGHGVRVDLEGATDVIGITLHGIRDALVALAAAFPVTLLGVGLASGRQGRGEIGKLLPSGWALPARLAVPAAAALVVLGLGVTALTFSSGERASPGHALVTHPPIVTPVPAGAAAEVGGLRVTTRTLKWVRHAPETTPSASTRLILPAATEPVRLYMEFSVENLGQRARTFGRKEVRLQGPSGAVWAPLAADFPAIRLAPHESLTTMLIFEVLAPEAGLQLAWVRGKQEVRIPIGAAYASRNAAKTRDATQ